MFSRSAVPSSMANSPGPSGTSPSTRVIRLTADGSQLNERIGADDDWIGCPSAESTTILALSV